MDFVHGEQYVYTAIAPSLCVCVLAVGDTSRLPSFSPTSAGRDPGPPRTLAVLAVELFIFVMCLEVRPNVCWGSVKWAATGSDTKAGVPHAAREGGVAGKPVRLACEHQRPSVGTFYPSHSFPRAPTRAPLLSCGGSRVPPSVAHSVAAATRASSSGCSGSPRAAQKGERQLSVLITHARPAHRVVLAHRSGSNPLGRPLPIDRLPL